MKDLESVDSDINDIGKFEARLRIFSLKIKHLPRYLRSVFHLIDRHLNEGFYLHH
jgi:hypothetical protein